MENEDEASGIGMLTNDTSWYNYMYVAVHVCIRGVCI